MKPVLALLFALPLAAQISPARLREHVRFLSHDLLEGRGPGTRGGELTVLYLSNQFAMLGAKPAGDNGTFLQAVPLIGVATAPGATMSAGKADFRWLDDFVGVNRRQTAVEDIDAPAVFVGYGIRAPEYKWDDYRGIDVRGKVAVMFTNEPPSDDEAFFKGRALTYYGRWTYKYEEALRQGALAAIIVHTNETAGYGWDVVRNSWGAEEPHVRLEKGAKELAFAGWVTREAGERLLNGSVDKYLEGARSKQFRASALTPRIRIHAPTAIREIRTHNVVAKISGSDVEDEAVVFTAHWDHLGATGQGADKIYNGAVDNATGCAVLLEIARAWSTLPQKPRRSAIFVATTAEEGGLRGSEFYAAHPATAPGKTVVNLNFDSYRPGRRTVDVVTPGAERTTLWSLVEQVARRVNVTITPDPRPERGGYFRSDHFSFARTGVPAFSVGAGAQVPAEPGTTYHQPSDEFREDWNFASMEQVAQFGFLLGVDAANVKAMPTWKPEDEYFQKRQKTLGR